MHGRGIWLLSALGHALRGCKDPNGCDLRSRALGPLGRYKGRECGRNFQPSAPTLEKTSSWSQTETDLLTWGLSEL